MSNFANTTKMITPTVGRVLTITTALALVMGTLGYTPAQAQKNQQQQTVQNAPQLSPAQLDQMVAPIALYPDNLLGQILAGSTYPLEVVTAARWSASNPRVSGDKLANAMQNQPWDPSVKALTAVPQVLKMMSDKIDWTQQLGEAYLSQPEDIAAAIQRLRARADASDNLKSSEQIRVRRVVAERPVVTERVVVERSAPEYIVIEPTYPERLYVPIYDPLVVYGAWAYPDYLPFYWAPVGYISVGIFGFGVPFFVGPALWASYDWGSGLVFCDAAFYSKFNHMPLSMAQKLASGPLKFDPKHHPMSFKNQALNTHFNSTKPVSHTAATDLLKKTTNSGPTHTDKLHKPVDTKLSQVTHNTSHTSDLSKKVTSSDTSSKKRTFSNADGRPGGGNKNFHLSTGNNKTVQTFSSNSGQTLSNRNNLHASLGTTAGGGNGGFKAPHATMAMQPRMSSKR